MISIKKTKFTAITILALFIGMVFCSIPNGPLTNFAEDPQINESQDIFTAPKPTDDSIVDTPATRSVIDYDQVYNSETVKTDIEFNKQSFDTTYFHSLYQFDGASAREFYPQYSVFLHDYSHMFTYDASYADFGFSIDSPMTADDWVTVGKLTIKIKADGDGTFYYGLRGKSFDTSANRYSITTTTLRSSVSVTKAELDYEGYYSLQIYLRHEINPTDEELRLYLYKETTDGKTQLGSYVSGTSTTTLGANSIFAEIDEFYFVRDTITNNIRSEIKYTSQTVKIVSIDIPSVPHAKEIRVYTDLNYSSINPTATVTRVSDYWKIASPVEITYKMLFTSTHNSNLALRDASHQYLEDVGFETGQYFNDWTVNYGNLSLNTHVSFDGFSSLDVGVATEYFEELGDACDFEVDVEEFDIKLNGLDTIDRFEQYGEWKLRLYEAGGGTNLGARRDNLAINTDNYTLFTTEIYTSGTSVDRVKITLHFSDASTQDYTELIPTYTMEEFSFDITAGKTIEDIDIYYGNSAWYSAAGDRIYVSYIEIKQMGSEISLTLPENDYYLSYSVYLQTGTMVLTTDDQTVVNDGSTTDRWITEFVFTHTTTVTLTTTLTDLDLTNFFDNFRIFQTSTTIKTLGSSRSQIDFDGVVADSYKFAQDSFRDYQVEIWDRTAQTLEYSYSVTTDEFGHGTITHLAGLEQKEYEIRTYTLDSYFGSEQTQNDVTNSLTDWSLSNEDTGTETASCVDSTIIFEFRESVSVNWEIKYNPSTNFDISSADILYYTYRSNVTSALTYKWIQTDGSNHILNQTNRDFTTDTVYHMVDSFRHSDYVETGAFDDTQIDIIYLRASLPLGWIKVEIFDFRFINAQKLYFTPSEPTETDYASTELLDAWDFSEGDLDGFSISAAGNDVVENGYLELVKSDAYFYTYIHTNPTIDGFTYTHYSARVWSNSSDYAIQYRFRNSLDQYISNTIGYTIADTWVTVSWDLSTQNNWNGVLATYKDNFGLIVREIHTYQLTDMFRIDYIELDHVDSWLEETNDYATDELNDAWDFEEGDNEEWSRSGNVGWTGTVESGQYYIDITDSVSQYCKMILGTTYSIDTAYYTHLVISIQSFELFDLKFYAGDNYVGGQNDVFPSDLTTYIFDLSLDADWTGTITSATYFRLDHDSGVFDGDEWYKIEYIYLIHQEEMPYSVIQNSVLLESETNDYQYNLYLDHNFVGTFSDLSLIPIPQTAGTHYISVQPFKTDGPYSTQQIFSYYYTVEAASFSISIENFYLSDLYVSTYVTSNYNGIYYVYTDNDPDGSGTLSAIGTTISTSRDLSVGVTINYAIKFVNSSDIIWFNTTYSNPSQNFFITDYRINTTAPNIIITWDTSKNTIDSLTAIEDGVEKATDDPTSTTSWTKSTEAGTHYVTLIFSATDYEDIIFSFTYTVAAIEEFQIDVENVFPSDNFISIYCTSNYDYSYTVYTNETETGSGNGLSVGTFIIIPKNKEAGLFNLTVVFEYGDETVIFMTWYSNLIPPLHPSNDLYRTDSQGFYNISLYTNLEFFWVDVWHDSVLIIDDSTEIRYSIPKASKVGLHNITLIYSYNISTDSEGYPIAEYNATISYEFWYETKLFYDIRIRYVPINYLGLAIGDAFEVSWVNTYFNGKLIFDGEIDDVPDYSNYTFIANDYIRIRNNMPIHNLTITDLFGRTIMYNLTIDISSFAYAIIELPVYRLGVVNNDDESHKISIRPYLSGEEWQTTPILPPGYQTEYWVCNRTYEIRILSVGSTTYDENGAMIELYDDITNYPELRTVPYVIVIPLDLVFEPEEEVIDKWWTKPAFIAGMSAIALIIILVAIYIVNKNVKKKERLNK